MSIKIRNVFTDSAGGWNVTRADLLAAVAAECDVIVINRAELPEVMQSGGCSGVHFFNAAGHEVPETADAGRVRVQGLALLALAEYLAAHPPTPPVNVDDVEALAGLMDDAEAAVMSATSLARRLLATGRVSVTHE